MTAEDRVVDYRKTAEAISRLTPEQYRVTQHNGTEAPGTGEYLGNKKRASMSILSRVSPCLPHRTSLNWDVAGQASPNRLSP